MVKELGLPQTIEKKLIDSINYAKSTEIFPKLLFIGCPQKYISQLLESIAVDLDLKPRLVDCRVLDKKNDGLAKTLTNINSNECVCFIHTELLSIEEKVQLEQAITSYQINIIIGKGLAARNILLDLSTFATLLFVDDISQVASEMLDLFYEIIDFRQCDKEFRIMHIANFAKQYQLNFNQPTMEIIARQFTNDEQLKMKLIDIRNQAFDLGIQNITEDFLQNTLEKTHELQKIDTMDGREFELFTGSLFRALGYTNVTVTQSSYDFGADVIAEKDDVRFAIQCKRYGSPVGVTAIQEVIASKSLHDCHVACVLTNSTFTPSAEELARKNLVILWDGNKLKEFIDRTK